MPVQASGGLNVKSLNIETINGILVDDFVDLSSTKVLQGSWHFPSAIIFGNLVHGPNAVQSPISPKELSLSIVKTSGEYTVSGTKV